MSISEYLARQEKLKRNHIGVYGCHERIPKGLIDYIRREMVEKDDVIIYERGNVRGHCNHCGQDVRGWFTEDPGYGNCPSCGHHVQYIMRTGVTYPALCLGQVATVDLGIDKKTVYIRNFSVARNRNNDYTKIKLYENTRWAIDGADVSKWEYSTWYAGEAWYSTSAWYKHPSDEYQFFVPDNIEELLQNTSLKYADLHRFEKEYGEGGYYGGGIIRYMCSFGKKPALEKLFKAGYRRIVNEYLDFQDYRWAINWKGKTIERALGLPKRILKTRPADEWCCEDIFKYKASYECVKNGGCPENRIDELADVINHYNNDLYKTVSKYGSALKLTEYLAPQGKKSVWEHDFKDYIEQCKTLGYDLSDKNILFPKDFTKAHEKTTKLIKYKENKANDEAIAAQYEKLKKYCFEKDGLIIRPAISSKELIDEGSKLHHCIAQYISRMAKGSTAIFFVRSAEKPNESFYTLELCEKRIVQCRTKNNKSYCSCPEVKAFVGEWMKNIVLKSHRKRKTA